MLVFICHQIGIFCLFAGLVVLLILIALMTKGPPRQESESPTTFSSWWLARVPDDVRRLEAARGARRFLTQELLASCARECSLKFRDTTGRIRW